MGSHSDNVAAAGQLNGDANPPDCINCGAFVGVASCGCGEVYQCNLLGKWCGRREPIDEFVSLLRRELNEKTYQCCRKCVFFVRMNHANVQQS